MERDSGSRSRSRSPTRRKHKKHRHKSRRSRSRERSPPRIHINPFFGIQAPPPQVQMGYSAAQLVQTNNRLEQEINHLKQLLMNEQSTIQILNQRDHVLTQENRNLVSQKANAEKRCNDIIAERRGMMDANIQLQNRIGVIDMANRKLQEDAREFRRMLDAKDEELHGHKYQSEVIQQQIRALNDRNAGLKSKCESMVAQNRQQYDEIQGRQRYLDHARLNVEKAEADLSCANIEIQRLNRELESSREKFVISQREKKGLEATIAKKDNEIRVAGLKRNKGWEEAQEKLKKLETKMKKGNPAFQFELSAEAIYSALETVKKTYSAQLARLEQEVEELRASKEAKHVELPTYLKTPQKPDPKKMADIPKTPQVAIQLPPIKEEINDVDGLERPVRCASGPPVDSPVKWHKMKMAQVLGTGGGDKPKQNGSRKRKVVTNDDQPCCSTSSQPVVIDICDEDELLAEPTEKPSPIGDLDLLEEQLLGDSV